MKLTALLSVLLASTTSFVDSASTYSCKVSASYNVYDDPNDPLIPTSSDRNWATGKIKSSYNAVHSSGNDFTMSSSSFTKFDYSKAMNAEGEVVQAAATTTALRGSKNEEEAPLGGFIRWFMRLRALNVLGCRLCSEWDDDDAMSVTVDLDALDASRTHGRWEKAWCDELQQGGKLVFEYAINCAIELYSCALKSDNPNGDEGGDAPEIIDVHPGPIAVGAGMAVIEAEIAAQEMHND
jgi:hypothetical protein